MATDMMRRQRCPRGRVLFSFRGRPGELGMRDRRGRQGPGGDDAGRTAKEKVELPPKEEDEEKETVYFGNAA
ncbi:hypothetical protein VCV18_007117 [Metarhizium anisopliae]